MNLLINGINGKMGAIIKELAIQDSYWSNVYGLCRDNPMTTDDIKFDVFIDFTHESALDKVIEIGLDRRLPIIIGTTGYNEIQLEKIKNAATKIPILYATNMSLGMNLLFSLVERTAAILGDNADIEVIEAHHNRKKDAPSGSAVTIIESIESGLGSARKHQYGRSGECPREKGEIGIHAIRGGNIVGYHEANFINELETIKICHEAYDRKVFANGALEAAKFIIGKKPKLYSMKDVLKI
ncbi:4-hydroxy-tetrahydrodipicolinate reductase [Tissierella praeacuta]|uniref:4-hydroxy-tetrahydrodipicolinate reductase n=1 Tax=Tissierella praeacuta TaxID=43131 RepID=UPI001C10BA21|nr:4-hydroxy-tetrahydrodipicolinate reductase [Tissierella praeacuta]MBU5255917.1 4-hydroxy-tetrahydrodipicolinate reductase [Tissierella praeacuta]